tara:strand:+ start:195 stop:497 length:303 start_codon:yes stop_codon:yes gene_type:complete
MRLPTKTNMKYKLNEDEEIRLWDAIEKNCRTTLAKLAIEFYQKSAWKVDHLKKFTDNLANHDTMTTYGTPVSEHYTVKQIIMKLSTFIRSKYGLPEERRR